MSAETEFIKRFIQYADAESANVMHSWCEFCDGCVNAEGQIDHAGDCLYVEAHRVLNNNQRREMCPSFRLGDECEK